MKTKFTKGDRVKRRVNNMDPGAGHREGTVSEVYGRSKGVLNVDILPGIFPEIYEVKWDDGNTSRGYLSNSLERIAQ